MDQPEGRRQWDAFSADYQEAMLISTHDVHYGPSGPGEFELGLLGEVRGRKVLELGCGGGQNSIAMARAGAVVTGLDFSSAQLDHARSLAEEAGVRPEFVLWDLNALGEFPQRGWERILSCFAVEYVPDLREFCRNVATLLAPGGRAVLCDLHPFVSGCDVVDASLDRFSATVDYFRQRPVDFVWRVEGTGSAPRLRRYHRTLSAYVDALCGAGLTIRRVAEPEVRAVAPDKPGLAGRQTHRFAYGDGSIDRQTEIWHRLPYTLVIVAEKGGY